MTFDDSLNGLFSIGHLKMFRRYALYLRDDSSHDDSAPPVAPPPLYNEWVYKVRSEYGAHEDLPPFSHDYVGAVPGITIPLPAPPPTVATAAPAVTTTATDANFSLRFAESQLAIANRATNAMMDQAERAAARTFAYRGRGGYRYNNRQTRPTDTYYGEGHNSYKRERTHSPDERVTRRRSRSPDRTEAGGSRRESPSRGRLYSRGTTHRTPSVEEYFPRGRRDDRTSSRRPSSRSMDEVARRSLERQLRLFQKDPDADIRKTRKDGERETHGTVSAPAEDVEMTPARALDSEDLIDLTSRDKGKQRDPAEGPGLSSSSNAAGADGSSTGTTLDFLNALWATDADGNILPPLPQDDGEEE
ncbi:hypothetical protein C8R44DRAFT_944782 [Mycena epipterygia]|nr:hypothetical protein C8R44DRAFT_944782 [Mycena epipterygia]